MTNEKTQKAGKRSKSPSKKPEAGEPKAKLGRGRPKGSKTSTKPLSPYVSREERMKARKANQKPA